MFVAVCGFAFIAVMIAIALRRDRIRTAAMKELAARLGFSYLGSALPNSFDLSGKVFAQTSSYNNVIAGERNGIPVVAFDCSVGAGRFHWGRTVIAVRTSDYVLIGSGVDLEQHRSEAWAVLFAPRSFSLSGLMPVSELGAYLDRI